MLAVHTWGCPQTKCIPVKRAEKSSNESYLSGMPFGLWDFLPIDSTQNCKVKQFNPVLYSCNEYLALIL